MMNKQAFHRKIFAAAALAFEYLLKQGRRTAQFGGYNVILQVFAAVALIALFRLYPAYAQQQTPTIAIIQPHDIKAYYEAVEGFLRYLGRDLKQDFNTIVYESPQGLYKTLAQNQKQGQPSAIDLLLTVGTEATAEAAKNIRDIPIVFTMVLDPESILKDRPDIVGTSLNIPIEYQFKLIQELLPTAENVGIMYDPARNADLVKQSNAIAAQFDLQVKPFPVTSQKDIPNALEQLRKNADVLLGIVDNTVYTSNTAKYILRYTVENRLPFIGISDSYVKAGALCALVFNNKDIGRQAAELAAHILAKRSSSVELRITTPENIDLAINLRTADIIGIKISEKMLKQAAIIYE